MRGGGGGKKVKKERKESRKEGNVPIRVINLVVLAQKLLLARLISQMSADEITILLGLQEGDKVDARPHLLAGEFTTCAERKHHVSSKLLSVIIVSQHRVRGNEWQREEDSGTRGKEGRY